MTFASVWRRLGAFLLDYLIIAAYLALLVIIGVGLGFGPLRNVFRALFADPNASELSAFVLLVLPVILYFALCESSAWQATWGKRRLGVRVVDVRGARLSVPRSLGRSLLKFAPWELTHACLWRIPGWPLAPATPSPIISAGLVLVWALVGAYLVTMIAIDTLPDESGRCSPYPSDGVIAMQPDPPAASGTKGLPGPTGRCIHHEAALQHRLSLGADGTRSKTLVLLLKGGTSLETPKHDSVGTGQLSGLSVAHLFVGGCR